MAAMSRRLAWSLLAALILAAAVMAMWTGRRTARTAADGPMVFISIDTLRADRLPVYGSTRTTAPNLDAFAADAVVFETAYAHSPQTLPSHTSILSGELPFAHGVRDNIGFTVKPGQRFLQHWLGERGYATGAFVSSYVLRRQTGIGQGFQTFDDDLPPASAATPLGQVQRPGDQTVAAATRWIDAQPSPRFFLFAHLFEPHTPYAAPAGFTGADAYDAEVSYADHLVGRLVDHLKARRLYDAATIVVFADHGEGLGDHGEDEHGIFLYRETIRVPLIIKLPRQVGGGRRVTAPVQHVDLVPTMLALTGVDMPQGRPGRSLVPLLDGSGSVAATPIYSESLSPRLHFGWSELFAISDERHRFVSAPREELYDLAQDPGERASVAADRPQVVSAMRLALERISEGARHSAPASITEEERRKLAALGYVSVRGQADTADRTGADPKDKIHVVQAYRRGNRLAAALKFADAAAVYRQLLAADPSMTDVWLQLAEAYQAQGRPIDALKAYQEVVARRPHDPAALIGAADSLLRAGRIAEARAHAEAAAAAAPAVAQELLVRIALRSGDADGARRHARLAQQADPTLPLPAFVEAVVLYQQGRFDAAAARFLEVRQASAARTEQLTDVNFLAADSLARLERYREAEPLFEAELALTPGHIRARAGLAMLYQATGRRAEAAAALDTLVAMSPTPEAYDLAAQLWTMFGEPARAAALRARAARPPG